MTLSKYSWDNMLKLLLKTLGVAILATVCIPLIILLFSVIPLFIGSLFSNIILGFFAALSCIIGELFGALYFISKMDN